jgi:hypothetical protein
VVGRAPPRQGPHLVRFGKGPEPAESLATDAAKADGAGLPHGGSTKQVGRVSGTGGAMGRRIEAVEIFDWYDGIVLGMVRLTWLDGDYLAALLHWSRSSSLRVFALLRIEPSETDRLKGLAGDWETLKTEVHLLFAGENESVLLVCVDERTEEAVAEARIEAARVAPYVVSEIGETLAHGRSSWLKAVGHSDDS